MRESRDRLEAGLGDRHEREGRYRPVGVEPRRPLGDADDHRHRDDRAEPDPREPAEGSAPGDEADQDQREVDLGQRDRDGRDIRGRHVLARMELDEPRDTDGDPDDAEVQQQVGAEPGRPAPRAGRCPRLGDVVEVDRPHREHHDELERDGDDVDAVEGIGVRGERDLHERLAAHDDGERAEPLDEVALLQRRRGRAVRDCRDDRHPEADDPEGDPGHFGKEAGDDEDRRGHRVLDRAAARRTRPSRCAGGTCART